MGGARRAWQARPASLRRSILSGCRASTPGMMTGEGLRRGMDIRLRHTPLPLRIAAPIVAGLVFLLVWWLVTSFGSIPATLLPSPGTVVGRLGRELASGRLWAPIGEATLAPYLAASQAIPAVALAPLLVIWVGYGMRPVVLLCSVMVFFPMVLSTVLGLRSIDREVLDAARVDGAAGAQMARWIEWPLALPATLTGVRNGFTLSITGAVVGELVMGGNGLGQRLAVQSQSSDTTGLFTTLIVLCVLAIAIYLGMTFIEWLVNPFASSPRWYRLTHPHHEK